MNKKGKAKRILFGYSNVPAFGLRGEDDGGFSAAVYEDGRLIYKTYIFDQIERSETEYKLSDGSISEIKALIENNQKIIDGFDNRLGNGSCDGCGNFFIFKGVQVITWNIRYTEPSLLSSCKEYLPAAEQENRILSLFFQVTDVLKNEGIDLNLDRVIFRMGRKGLP